MYERVLVNAEDARVWRRSPAPSLGFKDGVDRDEEFRLIVGETGLYEIRYEDLDGGIGPVPVAELGVYRKVYSDAGDKPWEEAPTPIHLVDEEGDATFGPGDRLYFWALGFRDAFVRYGYEDRYAADNVYWLGRGAAGGSRMDTAHVWEGAVAGTLTTFPETVHLEEELHYEWNPTGSDLDGLPPECDVEQWFWTDWKVPEAELPIVSYGAHPDSAPLVRARFKGSETGTHVIMLNLSNGTGQSTAADSFAFSNLQEYIYESSSLVPGGFFTEGENALEYRGRWYAGSDPIEGAAAFLDWIQLEYARRLVARDDYLAFASGSPRGAWAWEVGGFSGDDIRLFDVSSPGEERWVSLPPGATRTEGAETRLVFADSLQGAARWAAVSEGGAKRLSGDRIERKTASSLHTSEADYVIITHPLFLDAIEPLAAHREAQGYRVRVADVTDLYDEFSGGIKDPVAIRRYLQWGFEHWTTKPLFALLVGDASEDHRGAYAESSPDWVPSIGNYYQGELAAMDNWFARFDEDALLDLSIGRLPAGTESELEIMIDKILAYERFSPGDDWRGRVLLLSDDLCSGSTPYHCERMSEEIFEDTTREAADIARASAGAPLDVIEMHLSEYTGYTTGDGYHDHCLGGGVLDPVKCVRDSVYRNVTPALFRALNDGVLLFSFLGHGNRKMLFDEQVVADSIVFDGQWRADVITRSANAGQPYIAHGFGCHFGDFNEVKESASAVQDCLLEKMLLLPDKGAVAALGSTGFETLPASSAYEEYLYRTLFEAPPTIVDDAGGSWARWLLGEVQAVSIALLAASPQGGSHLWRYSLFGDPALVIDALPPSMSGTVDGVPVTGGQIIAGGDSSTVRVRVRVGDETAIDSTTISVEILEGDVRTPLTPGEDFRVVRDGAVADGRVLFVEYTHEVRMGDYDLLFAAQDGNGRSVSFQLGVRFEFQAWFDGRVAFGGSRVAPGAAGVVEVAFSRIVSEEDLAVQARGREGNVPLPMVGEKLDADGREWRLSFSLESVAPGRYDLHLTADSMERVLMSFEIARRLRVESAMAYPNPFSDETSLWFVLSKTAAVRIRIFTVAGRRVRVLKTEGLVDYNDVAWDGRDEDGERVANGTYLFQITARSGEEVATSDIGKVVRMK